MNGYKEYLCIVVSGWYRALLVFVPQLENCVKEETLEIKIDPN